MAKKDLNTVVQIERALMEKYGKDVIVDPRSLWDQEKEKQYLEEIKKIIAERDSSSEFVESNGFLVQNKLINRKSNRTCSRCKDYSFKRIDDIYLSKYSVCYKCYADFY